jgi:diaminobutyrate-2-oxoglutarate transaminase
MLWGLDFGAFDNYDMAQDIQASCFKRGLIVETAGRHGQVIKLLPPLTIPRHLLFDGLTILAESIRQYTVSAN